MILPNVMWYFKSKAQSNVNLLQCQTEKAAAYRPHITNQRIKKLDGLSVEGSKTPNYVIVLIKKLEFVKASVEEEPNPPFEALIKEAMMVSFAGQHLLVLWFSSNPVDNLPI